MKKLFLCFMNLPFPARKDGFSIRYFPIIEFLSKSYAIDLLVISNSDVDREAEKIAKTYLNRLAVLVRRPKRVNLLTKIVVRIKSLMPGQVPFPVYLYDSDLIEEFIREQTRGETYEVAIAVTSTYADIIRNVVSARRYVMDAIDSWYVLFSRSKKMGLIGAIDSARLREWELSLHSKMDYSSYVSRTDLCLLTDSTYDTERVGVIPNGIFINDYVGTTIPKNGFVIGYLGHMGYSPNIQAAKRLLGVFLELRKSFPDLQLCIIGRDPAKEIQELNGVRGVVVTGTVENIWPYVSMIDIFVFPMSEGAGQQNKVLEAMFAAVPVVCTTVGNGGIGAVNNQSIVIADTDSEMVGAISRLIGDKDARLEVGQRGREYVVDTFQWPSIFKRIEEAYLKVPRG